MLKPRLITALILVPIVVAAIYLLPPLSFFTMTLVFILLAGWEWAGLVGYEELYKKILYIVLLAAVLLLSAISPLYVIICISIIWWLIAITLLLIYPRGSHFWSKHRLIRAITGFFVLVPCWLGLIILQGFSPLLLIYCLILIWSVDSGAYFVGKKWGKHKLAPSISPGKTYEGLIGGLVTAAFITTLGLWLFNIHQDKFLLFIVICMVGGGLITVIGDLFESMIKRQSKVKDSGTLLPGHGGILDRIDSMTTAIPFFALFFPFFFNS